MAFLDNLGPIPLSFMESSSSIFGTNLGKIASYLCCYNLSYRSTWGEEKLRRRLTFCESLEEKVIIL